MPEEAEDPRTPYAEDGVDVTLIRWFLSLTPAERLEAMQQQVNAILRARDLNAGSASQAPAEKDRAVLPLLRRTLAEKQSR